MTEKQQILFDRYLEEEMSAQERTEFEARLDKELELKESLELSK